ncbi:hypothetical protein KO566_04205 [Flavobacteriaceae bacterium XHP0103]|uniref:hypothetical protein n=1 Tax=Marixanthotalea marina TaxID=2844359 RepID=UPI002989F3D6|nr:hypothetical protein [Marixanthotalea marina]MBU3821253.1 hypothetical protein [Marixanthotalea marina]
MGRKSKQKLQESQFLNKSEIFECLPEEESILEGKEHTEFAFNLYQFTKLIYENIK